MSSLRTAPSLILAALLMGNASPIQANIATESLVAAIEQDGSFEDAPAVPSPSPELAKLAQQYRVEVMQARIAQARFAIDAITMEARMYRHHQFWSDAAAVMVYLLTAFGMLCSAVQFRLFARLRGQAVQEAEHVVEQSAGNVELVGRVKVSSPFLGVIILVISLGFFSLYLTEVYPIKATTAPPLELKAP